MGAADRKKLPEYGPLGTGCPAIERAVAALYKGQNEESFWALMNAINYALELDTRVLVPLEAASDQPDGAAPWAERPVPAEKAKDLQPWTLRTQKGRCYLPVFTSVKMAEADKGTASRPMAERLLASAMQMALDSDSIDGVVIDPWTRSATLDCSLLNGLLHASHDTDEPGEAELRAGNRAMAEERWDDAMHYYQLSAEEGCAEGLAMMGEMLYEGRGCRKNPAQARKFWKKAADAGDVAAWVALGDDAMVQGKGAGAALRDYRKAQKAEQILQQQIAQVQGRLDAGRDAQALGDQISRLEEELVRQQAEYDALRLSLDALQAANTTLQNRFSPELGRRAAEIFADMTGSTWSHILLDREFHLSAESGSDPTRRSVQLLSAGTADQLYLAVRLAICEIVLPADRKSPLILDDALANFDDARLAAALDWLLIESTSRQILLFTCQNRESAYLAGCEGVHFLTLETPI